MFCHFRLDTLPPNPYEPTVSDDVAAIEMQATPAAQALPPLWQNRDYMLLWGGQIISVIGAGATQIVYPLLVLALTNSPAAAGIAGGLVSVPYIIFSLLAGALVDRWDRKRVMIFCDIGRALVLFTIPAALWFNVLTVWQIYACALMEGTLFVFYNVSDVAALSRVVDRAQLPQAVVQNQVAYSIANILAPSVGTVLFQLGRAFPFLFDCVTYISSVISLFLIRQEFQAERPATETHIVQEIRDGLGWLWHHPLIRFFAFFIGGLNFIGAATPLIIIVLVKNMGASDAEIGFVFSLSAVGAIVGSLLGGGVQKRFRFHHIVISMVCFQALLFPLVAFAPHIYVLALIMGVSWVAGPISEVGLISYRISRIPDALQGRVNSAYRLINFGFQPLGAVVSGVIIQRFGVLAAIAFFSVWYFGIALATLLNPHLRAARHIGHSAS